MSKKTEVHTICREFPDLTIKALQKKYEEMHGETISEPTVRNARDQIKFSQTNEVSEQNSVPTLGSVIAKSICSLNDYNEILAAIAWRKKIEGPSTTNHKVIIPNPKNKNKTYLLETFCDGTFHEDRISEKIAIILCRKGYDTKIKEFESNQTPTCELE